MANHSHLTVSELISHFGIDWKILLAQVANFGILLFLLKKFAYGPIVAALERRRNEIEKGLRFTKEAEENLRKIAETEEQTLRQARGDAVAIVSQAETTAKEHAAEIAGDAMKKSEAIIRDGKQAALEEKAKIEEEVFAGAEELVRAGIVKVLGKLPPKDRDGALIREALRELKTAK